jgi:hypothetical protein
MAVAGKVSIKTDAKVMVVGSAAGSAWKMSCAGGTIGGNWYRISAVNGKSVSAAYGVTYLYAPSRSFMTAPTVAPTPIITTPTPVPTPTPTPVPTPIGTSGNYLFGTLLTDSTRSSTEAASGIGVAHLEVGWDLYEPQDGVFNDTYIGQLRQRLATMRAAGLKVVLGAGLQYPPAWAYAYPDSRYVDQFGRSATMLNLTFNLTLRAKAEQYLGRIQQDLGLDNFWAIRVGSGGSVESFYPDMWDGVNANAYWGYDVNAQATSPLPGWKPGQTTLNGGAVTTAQVAGWYDWYLGALVGGVNWQLDVYRGLGYQGNLQVLMPGVGTRPAEYTQAINGYLGGAGDDLHTMGRGAVWYRLLAGIANKQNVVAYVSSMADGSGGDDLCASTDSGVAPTSSTVLSWSATRWISYLSDRYGLAKMGENPGLADTSIYGLTMLDHAATQMKACGFQGMMWAHDADLYSGTSGISLSDYSLVIRDY